MITRWTITPNDYDETDIPTVTMIGNTVQIDFNGNPTVTCGVTSFDDSADGSPTSVEDIIQP